MVLLLLLFSLHFQGIPGMDTVLAQPLAKDIAALTKHGLKPDILARLEAEIGDRSPRDIRQLAGSYNWGLSGKTKNHTVATALLDLAQHRGDTRAVFLLARQHHFGLGTAPNPKRAAQLYQDAARQVTDAHLALFWMARHESNSVKARHHADQISASGMPLPLTILAALKNHTSPLSTHKEAFKEPFTGMTLRRIPAGAFTRGSPPNEAGRLSEETRAQITLTRDFFMGVHEVTTAQWLALMPEDTHLFQPTTLPVVRINHLMIQEFLARLNHLTSGVRCRLPTEAEWEYACRAGTQSAYAFGPVLHTHQANFDGRYAVNDVLANAVYHGAPMPVGSYPPNAYGLYDMHGNVSEWCADHYLPYPNGPQTDPFIQQGGQRLVLRGGGWFYGAAVARAAARDSHHPTDLGGCLGFRIVADPVATP